MYNGRVSPSTMRIENRKCRDILFFLFSLAILALSSTIEQQCRGYFIFYDRYFYPHVRGRELHLILLKDRSPSRDNCIKHGTRSRAGVGRLSGQKTANRVAWFPVLWSQTPSYPLFLLSALVLVFLLSPLSLPTLPKCAIYKTNVDKSYASLLSSFFYCL